MNPSFDLHDRMLLAISHRESSDTVPGLTETDLLVLERRKNTDASIQSRDSAFVFQLVLRTTPLLSTESKGKGQHLALHIV